MDLNHQSKRFSKNVNWLWYHLLYFYERVCAGDQTQAGVKRPCWEVDPSEFLQITLRRSVFVLKVGAMLH